MMLRAGVALIPASLLFAAGPALAEKRALLIGVAQYDDAAIPDLRGPRADLPLMRRLAERFGAQPRDIRTLATFDDPAKPDARPTRANILAEFRRLATAAKRGDQILIYYSGHGSFQPDTDGDEADGLDELILPSDSQGSLAGEERIRNAITDDEIGAAIDAIRAKGAFVWLVVDACHAGTMLRSSEAPEEEVAYRQVDPGNLGIPAKAIAAAKARAGQGKAKAMLDIDAGAGGVVAFYAVHSTELAVEKKFRRPDGSYTEPVGLLTHALSIALDEPGVRSYRDLAARIYGLYGSYGGARRPHFEGRFDAPILGDGVIAPRRFLVRNADGVLRLDAGAFDGLGEGALVRLRDLRLAEPSSRVLARITDVDATGARLEPVDDVAGFDAFKRNLVRAEAELVKAAPALTVRVHVADGEGRGAATSTLAGVRAAVEQDGVAIAVAGAGETADLTVRAGGDRVWIGGKAADADSFTPAVREQPPYVPCAGEAGCAEAVTAALRQRARGLRLTRMASTGGAAAIGERMKVEYAVVRPVTGREGATACPAYQDAAAIQPLLTPLLASPDVLNGLTMGECDQLWMKVSYHGDKALDITPLYVGVDGAIAYFGPAREEDARILPGQSRWFRVRVVTTKGGQKLAIGDEDALLIAVEQSAEVPVRSYRWLAAPEATLRAGPDDDPLGLGAAVAPGAVRSGGAPSSVPATVIRLPLRVQAR